jgi:hypothetical protein
MTALAAGSGIFFIVGLMTVGFWLESINGKHGIVDEWLTPLPLGLSGCAIVLFERWTA